MSTISLEQLGKEFEKVALASAQTGEPVLVTKGGELLVKIMPATSAHPSPARPPSHSESFVDREEEIRKLPMTDSDRFLDEFRADRDL